MPPHYVTFNIHNFYSTQLSELRIKRSHDIFLHFLLLGRGFKISHHVGQEVKEGKAVPLHAKKIQRGSTGIALTILDTSTREYGWSATRPDCFTPGKETRYPLYRKLCVPRGRSEWVPKIPPPKFLEIWTGT
jgi:hypothetical protein